MNWAIVIGIAVAGLIIALAVTIGAKALLAFLGVVVVVGAFVLLMCFAYWYIFKKKHGG